VPSFTLLCPYDIEGLEAAAIHEGHRSHPFIEEDAGARPNAEYAGLASVAAPLSAPLAEPAGETAELVVEGAWSPRLPGLLAGLARQAGLDAARADDLALATAAVADAMARAGTSRVVRVWRELGAVLAELGDLAATDDPLAGREWPAPAGGAGRGLWLANQLCDLVQVRSSGGEAVVRLRVGH
jgi:hypothetical protein